MDFDFRMWKFNHETTEKVNALEAKEKALKDVIEALCRSKHGFCKDKHLSDCLRDLIVADEKVTKASLKNVGKLVDVDTRLKELSSTVSNFEYRISRIEKDNDSIVAGVESTNTNLIKYFFTILGIGIGGIALGLLLTPNDRRDEWQYVTTSEKTTSNTPPTPDVNPTSN